MPHPVLSQRGAPNPLLDWAPWKGPGAIGSIWDGDGVPPPGKDMGPVEILWNGDGILLSMCGLAHKLKILPSLILRMWAVKMEDYQSQMLSNKSIYLSQPNSNIEG